MNFEADLVGGGFTGLVPLARGCFSPEVSGIGAYGHELFQKCLLRGGFKHLNVIRMLLATFSEIRLQNMRQDHN